MIGDVPPDVYEAKWPYSMLDGYFIRTQANASAAHRHSLEKNALFLGGPMHRPQEPKFDFVTRTNVDISD
jgi:hypothetical protein